jgi:L-fuculose-phosphate aldolase
VVAAAQRLESLGLNAGTAGNVGLRVPGGLLVTPSGIPARELEPDLVVALGPDGAATPGQLAPTSEWRLHAAVLVARPDVEAIVHTHSVEATGFACLRRPLPAVHYVIARAGLAEIPCAGYATYGSQELADNVVEALGRGGACLMANHGVLTVAPSIDAAVALAADIEWLAGVYRRALTVGEPVVLPDDEIARVAEQFRTYGQPEAERHR